MISEKDKKRTEELVELLNRANAAYEQEDREIMSNYEYDRLYDELAALEQATGFVLSNSPTHRVGYEVVSALPKERHPSPMLSLDKTKDPEALRAFLGDHTGLLSWKMDGLTNVLTYRNGELVKAVTRGNGEIGEIITNNAKVYKNLPLHIPYTGELVIRGEAVITYSEFERINSEIEDTGARYKNPRNLCSGSVRQLNNEITAKRNVYLYVFALISTSPDMGFSTRHEGFEWLSSMGFTVVEERICNRDDFYGVFDYFKGQVAKNDFPSDGLVLSFDNIEYARSLGRTAKFPRDAMAFKWADEIAKTELLSVEWSASRTGLINPVAVFRPVELEGTTVSRASIHNVSITEGLKLGIGDEIEVYKANMIIPQIARNNTGSGTLKIPDVCPVCGMKTVIKDEDGVRTLYCVNSECPAKMTGAFTHFVSRDAMNIEGISENTIEKWVDLGILHNVADFYRLSAHREMIISQEGFGEKSYENAVKAIERSRNTTAARVLYALGVPGVGSATAKLVMKHFGDDFPKLMAADTEELCGIEGIGDVTAGDIVAFFKDDANISLVNDLLSMVSLENTSSYTEKTYEGMTFVITGSVNSFKDRSELKEYIEERGGRVSGSVSSKTDYLINNDSMSQSAKNKKAKELGVKVITEDEFLALGKVE